MKLKTCVVLVLCLVANSGVRAGAESDVSLALDTFHRAAAESNFETYSETMSADIVFLGTDANERWHSGEFREFARPHFSKGNGWTYRSTERHITIAPGGQTAWFDELLINQKLGKCRGSGVLVLQDGQWKLVQYNLSLPVPNELVAGIVADIAAFEREGIAPEATSDGAEAVVSKEEGPTQDSLSESSDKDPGCRQKRRFKTNRKAGC
ncbi:MAG: nuclear transport factor 2 family protein [Halioglobus sp.]